MKLLTVNFLTCAVKSCKSSLSSSSKTVQAPLSASSSDSPTLSSSPYPLHFRDAVLERTEIPYNPRFIENILPRVNWEALTITATELGLKELLPARNPAEEDEENQVNAEGGADAAGVGGEDDGDVEMEGGAGAGSHTGLASPGGEGESEAQGAGDKNNEVLRRLHTLLLETSVTEGKLVCGKCGFEYPIQEGVGNFLLPAHLGEYLSLPHLVVSALVTAEWSEDRLLGE